MNALENMSTAEEIAKKEEKSRRNIIIQTYCF